ncbi:MAG: hypothetical protein V7K40_02890 [Nostoc sp.]|uniref:hypothetical protein n=1 Tax=Nostoc sp. TaxID=1180 RepID=UPI002FF9C133
MVWSLESSGDKHKNKVIGGSDLCRKALWQWVFTIIEPKQLRLSDYIVHELGELLDTEKGSGRLLKLVRMKVAARQRGLVKS